MGESANIIKLAEAVRESTLKRLKLVPFDLIEWRPTPDSMSFADIARHLVKCDLWLFDLLAGKEMQDIQGEINPERIETEAEYQALFEGLIESGKKRLEIFTWLSDSDLAGLHIDPRFGECSVWWSIVRGCLDHEAHHRGQIAVYLKMNGLGFKSQVSSAND